MKKLLAILVVLMMLVPMAASAAFEITVTNGSEPGMLDPNAEIGNDVIAMMNHFFESLMKIDENQMLAFGQAESYDVSEDGLTYTFHLRDDILWSDGKPVTAGDFVYSWKRLVKGAYDYTHLIEMVAGYEEYMTGVEGAELGVAAPDDKTFVVTLAYPCPYFTEICAFSATAPVRQDIIETYGDAAWYTNPETYITNGAYTLESWTNQDSIVMLKSDTYYNKAAVGPDVITWLLMEDDNTILASYEAGDVMFAGSFPNAESARLTEMGVMNVVSIAGTYYLEIECQKGNEVLKNPDVVRALSLVIDRNYICDTILGQGQVPSDAWLCYGFLDADGNDYHDKTNAWWSVDPADYEANIAEAKELMAKAGYADGAGFPAIKYSINTSTTHQAVAEYIQSVWDEYLGVKCTIEAEEFAVLLSRRSAGDYEMARAGWTVDYNDPAGLMDLWVTGNGNNDAHYSCAAYDELIMASRTELDLNKRLDLYHQAEDELAKDLPVIPLYYYTDSYLFDNEAYDGFYSYLAFPCFTYVTAK